MTRKEMENETMMLDGNVCRMCVTDDIKELHKRQAYAKANIDKIYEYNLKRLEEKEEWNRRYWE